MTLSEPEPDANADSPPKGFFAARVDSVGFALKGLAELARSETHFQIEILATVVVVGLGLWFRIEPGEWLAVSLAIGLVMTTEAMNSAIERLVDFVHPKWHPEAGRVKDLAAGACLLAVICSLAVAGFVFGTRLVALF